MDIQYGIGPLIVILLALAGWGVKWKNSSVAIAVWVWLVLAANGFLSWGAIIRGNWPDILLFAVNLIAASSALDGVWFLKEHPTIPVWRYQVWWALFWASLMAIVMAQNLMISWIAIEFSTLASGALVVEMGHRRALEAAWKYIVIASVGLALALIGIIFVYAGLRFQGLGWDTLNYGNLARNAHSIPGVVRAVATIFIVSGIGTKVGLVPFHTWLPDAHSEAPSPVSGLLSGVLLGLSLVTIDRVVRAMPQPSHTLLSGPHLLILFGILSVSVGSLALLVQRDIKRLLAYSSIEQVGIMAIGFGIGTPLAREAALLQLLFHAVIKSTLFYLSGHLSAAYHTKRLDKITAIAAKHKKLAITWALGILALAGLPPLGLAYSEWMMLEAFWDVHATGLVIFLAVALAITFAALSFHLLGGLWGGLELSEGHTAGTEETTRDARHGTRAMGGEQP